MFLCQIKLLNISPHRRAFMHIWDLLSIIVKTLLNIRIFKINAYKFASSYKIAHLEIKDRVATSSIQVMGERKKKKIKFIIEVENLENISSL